MEQEEAVKGFSVNPIHCPHVAENLCEDIEKLYKVSGECKVCNDSSENWLCIKCGDIFVPDM